MRLNPRHATAVRSPKPHRRAGRRPAGDRPLLLEYLETRALPSVTFHPGQYQLPQVTNEIIPNDWSTAVGTLAVTEFYSVAFDPLKNVIFGGAQDNGSM
jgi:hypothetical protein